ncbi:hypothetical protein [Paraburkholderia terrae]|nr:hypothetical protein [Paraburkholderia terrae]
MKEKAVSAEASAPERVVSAAREVQAASQRLEAPYAQAPDEQPSTLELARFLAVVDSESEAEQVGLEWARAWVDGHV